MNNSKILKILIALIVGSYIVINSINSLYKQSEFVLDEVYLISEFVLVLLFIIAIVGADLRAYKKFKIKRCFFPTSIIIFSLFIMIGIKIFFNVRESSKPIFTAKNNEACFITLRQNGTYKISNYNLFGVDYFWGNYNLNDSLIALDRENFNETSLGKFMKMKSNDSAVFIVKVDKNGKIISDNKFILEK